MSYALVRAFQIIGLSRPSKRAKLYPIEVADFEKAIESTGYGCFNYLLLLITVPCCFTSVFATTTASFILPSAQCDLNLELVDKGALNAITYAGMISSAFFWGYVADILGRKKLLVVGYLVNAVCEITCAFSQTFWFLMLFKFLGGVIINGPFAVLLSYLSEFHGIKHRSRIMLSVGVFFSLATIFLPFLAMTVLTRSIKIIVIQNFITLRSWQIFLLLCSIPTCISGLLLLLFPESPKFLMSRGRNEEALAILQTVFNLNTGHPKESYPVKSLVNELESPSEINSLDTNGGTRTSVINVEHKGFKALTHGLSQLLPMFKKPLLGTCLLIFTIQFVLLFGINTIRLWMPQIFAGFSLYQELTHGRNVPLCVIVENYLSKKDSVAVYSYDADGNCISIYSDETYLNSIYMGIVTLVGYFIAERLVNIIGNKIILVGGLFVCGVASIGMYFANSLTITIVLSSIFVSLGSIASTALIGIAINSAPTSLRTTMISITMMFGRLGSIIGNLLFPILIPLGCLPPFLVIGLLMCVNGVICIFMEDTNDTPLQ